MELLHALELNAIAINICAHRSYLRESQMTCIRRELYRSLPLRSGSQWMSSSWMFWLKLSCSWPLFGVGRSNPS